MLLIFFLIGIVVATFVVAGWMVIAARHEASSLPEEAVVPINDLSSFEKKSSPHPASLPEDVVRGNDGNTLSKDLLQDKSVTSASVEMAAVSLGPESVQSDDVLAPVVSRDGVGRNEEEIRTLKEEVKLIREKAVIQAKNAIEVINKLRGQADQLREENKKLASENSLVGEKDKLICGLESEKTLLIEEAEALKAEMGRQSMEAQQAIEKLEADIVAMRDASFDVNKERMRLAQDIRGEYQSRLDDLVAQIEFLQKEKDASAFVESGADKGAEKGDGAVEELLSLRKAAEVLREERERLEEGIRELEAQCAMEVDKNSFFQYELTKSRAQAMGMERIYENSRKQIEDLVRQVSDTRLDNKELKKQTDVLEKSLNDFKRLNAELIKREKLSQFEIERSRGELRDLERIYDGFRSRIEKVGMADETISGQ